MGSMRVSFSLVLAMACALTAGAAVDPTAKPVKAENFRLMDQRGESHELYRYANEKAVVLYVQGNGCPIARQSYPELRRVSRAYRDKDVVFFMLNANSHDMRADVEAEMREFRVNLPVLLDPTQVVARSLGLERTCEVLVLRPSDWSIAYRGPVDDRFDYGAQKPEATQQYLRDALDKLLAGAPVDTPQHETKGCKINLFDVPAVTYNEVAPILEQKCTTCHREGAVGPFAMQGFTKVSGWADMIREVVMTDQMPPWHADPEVGKFKNDHSLTQKEKETLVAWVESGAPRGDEAVADPLADLPPAPPGKWKLGTPDVIVSMPEPHEIPAEGVLNYVMVEVPGKFEQDTWIRGIEVAPGAIEAVHHALIFIKYPEAMKQYEPDADGGAGGFFGGFVPGMDPFFFPEGTAKFVPAGASFLFQMHYVTNGKPHQDQTEMGLYVADAAPAEQLETIAVSYGDFEIPPFVREHAVLEDTYLPEGMKLWSFAPHMHYRGARMRYTALTTDSDPVVLCSVPNYKFDWQRAYQLAEPFVIPADTRIQADGAFDNSVTNPYNPDPSKTVAFGEQTYDEMFVAYMDVSAPQEVFRNMADREGAWEERKRKQFLEEHADYLKEEPFTREELEGTYWSGGDWKFRFNKDNVLLVNGLIKGKWVIENNKVVIDVVGSHFELDIMGKHLVSHGHYEIERLE